MGLFAPDDWDDEEPTAPYVEVEISGPEILGVLLGPKGETMFTLVDRPIIPFGFSR